MSADPVCLEVRAKRPAIKPALAARVTALRIAPPKDRRALPKERQTPTQNRRAPPKKRKAPPKNQRAPTQRSPSPSRSRFIPKMPATREMVNKETKITRLPSVKATKAILMTRVTLDTYRTTKGAS